MSVTSTLFISANIFTIGDHVKNTSFKRDEIDENQMNYP